MIEDVHLTQRSFQLTRDYYNEYLCHNFPNSPILFFEDKPNPKEDTDTFWVPLRGMVEDPVTNQKIEQTQGQVRMSLQILPKSL